MKLHLQHAAYQVVLAENGMHALRQVYDTPVDVALIDLCLGDEYGITVMEQLHHVRPDLPVIIMTASTSPEAAREANQKGAAGYLPKPFQAAELLHTVEQVVTRSEGNL